jgi:hypothetical protein
MKREVVTVPINVEVVRSVHIMDPDDTLELTPRAYGNAPALLILRNEKYEEIVFPVGTKWILRRK